MNSAKWIIAENDTWHHGVVALEDHGDVPVLIRRAGTHPRITEPTTGHEARINLIDVVIAGWTLGDETRCTGAYVSAVNKKRQSLLVGEIGDPLARTQDLTLGTAITKARTLFDTALDLLPEIEGRYARANEIHAEIGALPRPFDRAAYESACARFGVSSSPDDKLTTWGSFTFPHYGLDVLPRLLLNQKRAFEVERERLYETRDAQGPHVDPDAKVVRTYTTKLPEPFRDAGVWRVGHEEHRVIKWGPASAITADDPSIYGHRLLGHEGEQGYLATVEVRCLTRTSA